VEQCFVLLAGVAADWLACFPSSGARWLFDEFFRQAPPIEVLLNLSPFLGPDRGVEEKFDAGLDSRTAVSAQARRSLFSKSFLVGLCMLLAVTM
jgi:hypothetical protein